MNTQLKFLTAILMLFSIPGLAQAQGRPHDFAPEQRAEVQTEWMADLLDLDEATAEAVRAINLKYAQEMERVMDPEQRRMKHLREMKALRDAKDAELKQVLTEEQFQILKQERAELRHRMKEEGRKHRSERPHSGPHGAGARGR